MSIMKPTEEERIRELKLPAWAFQLVSQLRTEANYSNQRIIDLEKEVAALEERIAVAAESDTGPDDSTAWLWRCTSSENLPSLGLGADAAVDFTPTGREGVEITVNVEEGGIKIASSAHLAIYPLSSRGEMIIRPA